MSVKALQQRLLELGFQLPRFGADGDFGGETQTAIHHALNELEIVRLSNIANPPPAIAKTRTELQWVGVARSFLGVTEIKGSRHRAKILEWWRDINAPFADDETPWCGAFVGGVLSESGRCIVTGGASAKSWLKLPVKLDRPAYGCVVVFHRPPNPASGHVAFVVGEDAKGNLMCLGGNQGNTVSIKPFAVSRVAGYRWPSIYPSSDRFDLPLLKSDGKVSTSEA